MKKLPDCPKCENDELYLLPGQETRVRCYFCGYDSGTMGFGKPESESWTPLPNGYNTGRIGRYEIQIGIDSGKLYIFNINQNRKCWTIDLPNNVRLCSKNEDLSE